MAGTNVVKKGTTTRKTQAKAVVEDERQLTSGIIAIDNGGYNCKIFSESMETPFSMPSKKAYGHNNFKLITNYPEGTHTYKIKWNDKYYFTGMLLLEAKHRLTGYTNTKATDFFTLSILTAIALYGYDVNKVVTCTPMSRYSEEEKDAIRESLIGTHDIEINGVNYNFEIEEVIVTAEATTPFFAIMPEGTVRWLDLGSRTVGYASTLNEDGFYMPLEKESGTIEKEGLDISGHSITDFSEYVENLAMELNKKWDEDDYIIAFGGGALIDDLVEALQEKYPNLVVAEDPLHLQVRGMLEFGKALFAELNDDDADE